jgi:hypothetical protein
MPLSPSNKIEDETLLISDAQVHRVLETKKFPLKGQLISGIQDIRYGKPGVDAA